MKVDLSERGVGDVWKIPKGLGVVYLEGVPNKEDEIELRKNRMN